MQTGDKYLDTRRTITWLLPAATYGCFYSTRYNFTVAHPRIAELLGWSYSDYGVILTAGLAMYGLSVFLLGPLIDKIGGRLAITIGAIGSAIFNIIFGLTSIFIDKVAVVADGKVLSPAVLKYGLLSSTMISMMTMIWSFNATFQSLGALSITKINSAWFAPLELGQLSARVGSTIQIGRSLVYWLCPLLLALLPWQFMFWIPAILLMTMGIINYSMIRNTPEEIGYKIEGIVDEPDNRNLKDILKRVFLNPTMWGVAAISVCLGISRNSIDHWFIRYFQVVFSIASTKIITFLPYKLIATTLPFFMIMFSIIAGKSSDGFFKGHRAPVVVISFFMQFIGLVLLHNFIMNPWIAAGCIILILSAIQFGHGLIVSTTSIELGGRKAAATATGFIDGAQYLVGSTVGYGMGKWLDMHKVVGHKGAEFAYWPIASIPAVIMGLILASIFLQIEKKRKMSGYNK